MNVNFKGLYAIYGESILHAPVTKVEKFLEVTKSLRKSEGKSYLDKDTFDYCIDVQDNKESLFEKLAHKYKLKIKKANITDNMTVIAGNRTHAKAEMESIFDFIIDNNR